MPHELVFVTVLLVLSVIAWLTVHRLATPDMRAGILTGHSGMAMDPMSGGLFLGIWLVMMAAMMLPAITPVMVRIDRLMRRRGKGGTTAYALAAGYLVVWAVAGTAAYGLFLAFQRTASAADDTTAARIGAVVLLLAGVYQFTPLKRACLRQCRSPLAVLVRHGQKIMASRTGALWVGLHHGAFCVGCCWALMAVLLAAGMMSLVWMGAVATVVLTEKVFRYGELFSRLLGAAMIALALTLVAAPGVASALT
jgi:predicted metal-binding membrane protein